MKLAVVFPGQGSQHVGMLRGFDELPCVRETLETADAVLGGSFSELIRNGSDALLNETAHTQPVLLTVCVAMYRALSERVHLKPIFFAGHSLGEYTAYVASGRIRFEDALRLVKFRAERMQEVALKNPGGMSAVIGLNSEETTQVCQSVKSAGFVEPANFNAALQTVIAGTKDALEAAKKIALQKGARCVIDLPVSAAFHTHLFEGVAESLREKLNSITINSTTTPVIANIDAMPHEAAEEVRLTLSAQTSHPVQWLNTMRRMEKEGVSTLLECGPGRVITGLAKRTMAGVRLLNCSNLESIDLISNELAKEST